MKRRNFIASCLAAIAAAVLPRPRVLALEISGPLPADGQYYFNGQIPYDESEPIDMTANRFAEQVERWLWIDTTEVGRTGTTIHLQARLRWLPDTPPEIRAAYPCLE